jgi:hypothetical protein
MGNVKDFDKWSFNAADPTLGAGCVGGIFTPFVVVLLS